MANFYETVMAIEKAFQADPAAGATRAAQIQKDMREQGLLAAKNEILSDHQQKIIASAESGRRESLLYQWSYHNNLQFKGCFLRDLINKNNLIQRLQEALDGMYGAGRFKVYSTLIGKNGGDRDLAARRFGIFVSWNQDDWPRIDALMASARQHYQELMQVKSADESLRNRVKSGAQAELASGNPPVVTLRLDDFTGKVSPMGRGFNTGYPNRPTDGQARMPRGRGGYGGRGRGGNGRPNPAFQINTGVVNAPVNPPEFIGFSDE